LDSLGSANVSRLHTAATALRNHRQTMSNV
jgi:hypothetical protein